MDTSKREPVPQDVIDKINASLDAQQPPFTPKMRAYWFDKGIEHYYEGVEHGLSQVQSEVHVGGLVGQRIATDIFNLSMGQAGLQEFKEGVIAQKDMTEIFNLMLQQAFMKGMHFNYLLREKGITNHEELYKQLAPKKTT